MLADETKREDVSFSEVKKYKERLNIALKAAKICVFEVDVTNQLYTFFENSEDIFGVPGEIILRDVQPFSKLSAAEYQRAASEYFSHPDDFDEIDRAFQSIYNGKSTTYEARMRAGGSDYVWCKLDVSPVFGEDGSFRMIGVITDISALKSRRDCLEEEVKHDNFTGLYNKQSSLEKIQKILREEADKNHALILVDIDNFKHFNDTYGHAEGDKIIKEVAAELKSVFRGTDVIGRFGGDEFLLFVSGISSTDWIRERLQRLTLGRKGKYIWTNSIGAAFYPKDGETQEELFKKADEALYRAKLRKGTYEFYSPLM